jgi:high-affinity nickel-transport protein
MMHWKMEATLAACLVLGLRHGFDYDHLAAISDIAAVQTNRWRALGLGLFYALGHALTVAVLGVIVIQLHVPLPGWLDGLTERLIGATLIILGVAVVAGLMHPHAHPERVQSRIAAGVNLMRTLGWRLLRMFKPERERPALFAWNYSGRSIFLIGMLHGVGAETPSQLMLFFLASRLGGTTQGLLGLAAFAAGLVTMNGLMTASLAGIFGVRLKHPLAARILAWTGAAYSCGIGVVFLFGWSSALPNLM